MKLINKFKSKLILTIVVSFVVTTMFSCSHGPAIQDFPDTANPKDELAKLDIDMNEALGNQVDVLSPSSFKEAQLSLKNAKKSLEDQREAKDILHYISEGRAYLNQSNNFAKLSHDNVEDVIIARQNAISAGVRNYFATDFQKADESLMDVTLDIEKNELKKAIEKRSSLQLTYLELELRSIKQTKLGDARNIIAQAVKEGAKEFAPRTLAMAEKSVQETDAFITANRKDTNQINLLSYGALNSAKHLLKITRDSKTGKKTSSEEIALQMESEKNKVADKESQLYDKENQLENKQIQLENKDKELVKGEETINVLAAKNSNLESEQAFNKRFEEAQSEFSKSEAEVYKQGNTLTIRLRGLKFPVSKAVLKGSNFPLLAKVQRVIRGFGKTSIIVEGHTDSIGGKALNKRLSTERAEAVREYLLSNVVDGDQSMTIQAVGYGYQKPLATNKTNKGRAQNRRVDILIHSDEL